MSCPAPWSCLCVDCWLLLQYICKRKALGLTDYGLIDAQAIKRQKLGGGTGEALQLPGGLTQAMVEDYNSFQAQFNKELNSRKQGNALDLGNSKLCCI